MPQLRKDQRSVPPFVRQYASYTTSLARFVVDLCRVTTIKGAAEISGLSWDVVKEIEKERLRRQYQCIPLRHLRHIGVDEIAVRKGHRYATIVTDLCSGRIVWVAPGRKKASLGIFLQRLKRSGACIEAVVMDLCAAYTRAMEEHLPGVPIVYDHFHVVQLMNAKLDELRRAYVRDAGNEGRRFVKGARWLVLMGAERLEQLSQDRPDYRQRLDRALEFNEPLATGYYLKEKLRLLWNLPNRDAAAQYLSDWCAEAHASGLKPLQTMAAVMAAHAAMVLAYFDHGLTNGFQEGINHKIKTLKRMAYGFRDWEFFTLKLYALHEARYKLVG
jgi:transposase